MKTISLFRCTRDKVWINPDDSVLDFVLHQLVTIFRQIFRRIIMSANGSGDNAVADTVKQLINDHKVIVFSKTYCMFFLNKNPRVDVFIQVLIVLKQKIFLENTN